MSEAKKSFLIINRKAPYGSSAARDALDVALTISVFEQPLSLLFMGDGVLQLLPEHIASEIGQKNLSANLAMLEMYDIDRLYVCRQALEQRGIRPADIRLNITLLDQNGIAALIKQQDQVLSF
ncbi:sulfurtransferase complex subunit TusC [Amphritea pacifica]|uniref:Sulfurtransferase complex subunit TusC n=1 Tax=Amphritea pacifica TaxID=2811233 RepID=A0ABS2W8C8_9GAMM|nr:sulfurtransferase complex subunit TusC [Amphritea pacifica]MBN0987939.1 sulfurtransferase complex subunit TusC [Amphritea pacifica]MBN1005477.1 sulfurtransferase complex subunit TusC [Amphritea pacifica]